MKNKALEFFRNSYDKKMLSHLYLIVGPKGSGKEKLAKDVAAMIIDDGNTQIKTLIDKEEYPNFFHIKKDGLSIKKQQILNLQEEFSKTSLVDGARVYVISDVETMSNSAANSLLKFMEEPENNNTVGLLLTKSTNGVLPTIISRSQVIKLAEIDKKELIMFFIANDIDENSSYMLSLVTNDLDEAQKLSKDHKMNQLLEFFIEVVNNLTNKDYLFAIEILKYRDLFNIDRIYMEIFTDLLFTYVLDLYHVKTNEEVYFHNFENILLEQTSKIEEIIIIEFLDVLKNVILKQKANINIDLLIDLISINILSFRKDLHK